MQSQLCHYEISSTHLSVLTRLYGLIVKTSDLGHGAFKNAGLKRVRGRFHGRGSLVILWIAVIQINSRGWGYVSKINMKPC